MQNITKPVVLGLLLVLFVAVAEPMKAVSGEMKEGSTEASLMSIPTDNGSTNVEVSIERAMVEGDQFTIDQPQVVTFNVRFLDPATGGAIEHVNYGLMITDANGNTIHKVHKGHTHDGTNSYSLSFSDAGSFTLTIDIEGTGGMKPFDTTYTGTASSSVTVTPEFPLSVMAIMAAVVGMGVAATRFKNPLKL